MSDLVETKCSGCGCQTKVWCYTPEQRAAAEANECLCPKCGASQASHLNFLGLSCIQQDRTLLRGYSPLAELLLEKSAARLSGGTREKDTPVS